MDNNKASLLTRLLVLFLIVLLISLPNLSSLSYNYKRIFEIALLLIILLLKPFSNTNLLNTFNKKTKNSIGFLLFLGILSSLLSENPKFAFIELISVFSIFIASIYISTIWNSKDKIITVFSVLAIGFFLLEIKFYAYYFAFIVSGNQFSIHDFFPAFANARFFNQYQIWTLPFLTLLVSNLALLKNVNKKLLVFIAISWWIMFFTTGSRGAIVAVIIACLLTLFFFRNTANAFLKTTLLLALSGFVLYQILFHLLPYLLYQDSEVLSKSLEIRTNSSARITLWIKALYFIKENPFLGIGPMHYAWHEGVDLVEVDKLNHPHNSFLQWGAEWGLLSLSLMSYLFFQGCKSWFKKFNYNTLENHDKSHGQLIIALSFSVSSAAIYSLFSGIIVMPMSHLMGILVFSMMLGVYNTNKIYLKHKGFSCNFLLIPVALFYFYLLIPDILDIVLAHKDTYELRSTAPRFWVDGNINKP